MVECVFDFVLITLALVTGPGYNCSCSENAVVFAEDLLFMLVLLVEYATTGIF